jgi:ABC-type nitrate/sulfonate/bicarbonate transport system permease component
MTTGEFWAGFLYSLEMFVVGLAISIIVGVVVGLVMGWIAWLQDLLDPLMMLIYTVPRDAAIPLLIIWFGVGRVTEIWVVFIGAVFPILLNTVAGVKAVDPALVRAAKSFGGSSLEVFRTVLLPGALPTIMTGIRLGIGRSVMGIVVVEMYLGMKGIGSFIIRGQAGFNVDHMLFNTFVVSLLGYLAVRCAKWVENRYSSWREGAA